jgi:hypothetical protein
MRFQAGEVDIVTRVSADTFDVLARKEPGAAFKLYDLGAGLDYGFLFFNLNDADAGTPPPRARTRSWFRQGGVPPGDFGGDRSRGDRAARLPRPRHALWGHSRRATKPG